MMTSSLEIALKAPAAAMDSSSDDVLKLVVPSVRIKRKGQNVLVYDPLEGNCYDTMVSEK